MMSSSFHFLLVLLFLVFLLFYFFLWKWPFSVFVAIDCTSEYCSAVLVYFGKCMWSVWICYKKNAGNIPSIAFMGPHHIIFFSFLHLFTFTPIFFLTCFLSFILFPIKNKNNKRRRRRGRKGNKTSVCMTKWSGCFFFFFLI